MKDITIIEAKDQIRQQLIRRRGEHSHHIVSATLRIVAKTFGTDKANELIKEFDLTKRMRIAEVKA